MHIGAALSFGPRSCAFLCFTGDGPSQLVVYHKRQASGLSGEVKLNYERVYQLQPLEYKITLICTTKMEENGN